MYKNRKSFLKSRPFRAMDNFRRSEKGLTIIETTLAIAIFSFLVVFCLGIFIYIGRVYYHGLYENRAQEATRNIITTISESLRTSGVEVEVLEYSGNDLTDPRDYRGWHGYCIGNVKYSYRLNTQLLDLTDADIPDPPPLNYEPIDNPQPPPFPPPPPNPQHDLHDLHPLDAHANPNVENHKLNYDGYVFLVSRSCEVPPTVIPTPPPAVPNSLVPGAGGINESVELLDERMRIIYFSINPATPGDSSLYNVSLKIAYGGYADAPEIDHEVFEYEQLYIPPLPTPPPPIDEVVSVDSSVIDGLSWSDPFNATPLNEVVSGEYRILRCRRGETFCAVSEAQTKVFRKIR